MFYVYILKGKTTRRNYKGMSDNLERRLKEHFSGRTLFGKSNYPIELVHVEICKTRQEARKLEKYFKSGYGREIIKEIF